MRDSYSGARRLDGAASISSFHASWSRGRFAVAAALALFCLSTVAPAQAHGRLGAAYGRCRLYVGPDIMNFTGYLPEASKNEFCEDIPATGPVIMVLDAEQEELRDMAVEIRIVKDVGSIEKENEDIEAVTVAHQPPKVYRSGTINFEHTFPEPGYFVGIVTVTGKHGESWVSRFPFSVDKTFMRDLPVYATLSLGVLAAFAIYLIHRRRAPSPVLVTAAAAFKAPPPFDPPPPAANDDISTVKSASSDVGPSKADGSQDDRTAERDDDDAYKRQAAE